MIRQYTFLVSALCLLLFAVTTNAQQSAGATAAQLPVSKMAVIYSDLFQDSNSGIVKFKTLLNRLNGEFQRTKDELTQMQTRAQSLESEINKLRDAPEGTPIDQRSLQSKIDQLDQMKRDLQRKSEDAQAAYDRRRNQLFTPLLNEIGKALEAFAKARGINSIIDAAQVPLLYASESIDITRAFIAEFNGRNPGGAGAGLPRE